MKREALLKLCRSLPHATQDVKWKKDLVFSVGGKMFACFNLEDERHVGFKTTPQKFRELIQQPGIIPAPYAARFHWVSLERTTALPAAQLKQLITESYLLVAEKLPAGVRRKLGLFDDARAPVRRR
jgi:predicted DNA-binding protein (MmcQ/YjbR family)